MTTHAAEQDTRSGSASFDVERFEWSDGRIELAGVWSGVGGMRFIRPTLVLQGGDTRRRLLAVLDHKPWDPNEGARWEAAFPWEGEPMAYETAELHVAPGIDVALAEQGTPPAAAPMKRPPGKRTPKPPTQPADDSPPAPSTEELQARIAQLERERDDSVANRRAAARELESLRQAQETALADARAQERDKAAAALAEGAELRARVERERDEAFAVRDQALRERDAAVSAKENALRERKDALADRKVAFRERDHAKRDRDNAFRAAEDALAQRAQAVEERDRAMLERDVACNERDGVIRAHERGLPPKPAKARYTPEEPRQEEIDLWLSRGVPIVTILIFLIVVLRLLLG